MNDAATKGLTLAEGLAALARKGLDFSAYLTTVHTHEKIEDTKSIPHIHHISLDGSSLPRLQDFTNYVSEWILEYVIPRKKLMEATSGSAAEIRMKHERLRRQAIETFKTTGISGEQGEMLLFVLAEAFLGFPQLLCKMDIKTDRDMHFHGLDGIHCGPGDAPNSLAVYWCESKVHASLDNALSQALDGLKPFLLAPGTGQSDKRRELALLDRYMGLDDVDLQKRIMDYLNPDSPEFNTISWRGICLIGFDYDYPQKPNAVTSQQFMDEVKAKMADWVLKVKSRAKNRGLESFEIHMLFVPFGLCEDFRACMKTSLGLA